MNYIKKLFSKQMEDDQVLLPKIAFHMDAAPHGNHGSIVVTSKAHHLIERSVAFVFVGRQSPPPMDLATVKEIWRQAMEQGYMPLYIEKYGLKGDQKQTV